MEKNRKPLVGAAIAAAALALAFTAPQAPSALDIIHPKGGILGPLGLTQAGLQILT